MRLQCRQQHDGLVEIHTLEISMKPSVTNIFTLLALVKL